MNINATLRTKCTVQPLFHNEVVGCNKKMSDKKYMFIINIEMVLENKSFKNCTKIYDQDTVNLYYLYHG